LSRTDVCTPTDAILHSLASVEIDRPIDEVFTYTNEKVPEWSLTVVEDEVIEDKSGVGTTFRCVTEERGRRMDFQGVITQWEPRELESLKRKLEGSAGEVGC
jgi:hypothetical protein